MTPPRERADGEELAPRRRELIARSGPWQHHNIDLGGGVYTMGDDAPGQQVRLPAIVQVATDLLAAPLDGARVLDLAAHEGLFAVEFARRGARVVAVEIRDEHVEKAEFARDALDLRDMEVRRDDVRNVTRERYGEFDLVLCLGILYHLDARAAFALVEQVTKLCRRLAILDTHFSVDPAESFLHRGVTYRGRSVWEHDPASTADERARAHGASFDNPESVWLTKPSLFNLLRNAGFTSVLEVRVPRPQFGAWDRTMLAAVKGTRQDSIMAAPRLELDAALENDWPEHERRRVSDAQTRRGRIRHLMARALPVSVRRAYRRRRLKTRR
ncbi:MAG TPA: class I SAM-dependent methyltransferase [Solirubrobacterales bacterium]|nr:class I SAM-dependent methyltransferase [Solirubrobacterales bacterium]